jgi:hypothetical protein
MWFTRAAAAPAASAPQTVTDPSGRYTISFPTSWEVVSLNATPVAGQMASYLGKTFPAMLMAIDPGKATNIPAVLMVVGMPMETAVAPRTFGLMTDQSMSERLDGYAMIREGTATIANRPAFYRYFTMQDKHGETLYSVLVYFTVGKTGYVIFGATENQPEAVRKSFGDISRILETFHPTGK